MNTTYLLVAAFYVIAILAFLYCAGKVPPKGKEQRARYFSWISSHGRKARIALIQLIVLFTILFLLSLLS